MLSIGKFSIVIGSPRAYLSHYRMPVIGYPLDLRVNYARFTGFLRTVFYSFQSAPDVFALKKLSKDIFNSEICYRYD